MSSWVRKVFPDPGSPNSSTTMARCGCLEKIPDGTLGLNKDVVEWQIGVDGDTCGCGRVGKILHDLATSRQGLNRLVALSLMCDLRVNTEFDDQVWGRSGCRFVDSGFPGGNRPQTFAGMVLPPGKVRAVHHVEELCLRITVGNDDYATIASLPRDDQVASPFARNQQDAQSCQPQVKPATVC